MLYNYYARNKFHNLIKILKSSGYPLTFLSSGKPLKSCKIYGNSLQEGTPTPENHIEVKSVGELITDTASDYFGKYKISVTCRGKNLFDVNGWYDWLRSFTTENVSKVKIDGINCIYYTPRRTFNQPYMQGEFKENTVYTLSFKAKGISGVTVSTGFVFNYTDGTKTVRYVANNDNWNTYVLTSPTNKTIKYISMGYNEAQGCYFDENSIQLEENSAPSEYEKYNKPKTTEVYLDKPLRMVGNNSDYIDFKNKKIIRNIGKIELSSLSYSLEKDYWVSEKINDSANYSNYCILTNYPCVNMEYILKGLQDKCASLQTDYTGNPDYYQKVIIRDTGYKNDVQFKNSLSGEYLYYELANPTEELAELQRVQTVKGTNILTVKTAVNPSNTEIEYYK